jgi:hypothetical protein
VAVAFRRGCCVTESERRSTVLATFVAILIGVFCVPAAAQNSEVSGAELLKHLSGNWKAAEERTPRGTALDEQVFGRGAVDVRDVALAISPSGEATLHVRKSVVGARGKVFAPSLTEVKMQIGDPVVFELGHLRPTVTVTSAEDRYLDGDKERFQLSGLRVTLSLVNAASGELNMQFEPADGRDGFGTTLTPASSGRKGR